MVVMQKRESKTLCGLHQAGSLARVIRKEMGTLHRLANEEFHAEARPAQESASPSSGPPVAQ